VRVPIGGGCWLRLGRHPDLEQVVADLEPWTIGLSGALREARPWWACWVASVEDRRATLLGALVLERVGADWWNALPLVLDERAVAPLAFVVDRSPARRVFGTPTHVEPMLDGLSRARSVVRLPFHANPLVDPARPFIDPRTRVAGLGDVPAVLDVLETYGNLPATSRRARRQHVERAILDRVVVVIEVGGRVVGAVLADAFGRDYLYVADLAVHPDFRGQGLSWPLLVRFCEQAVLSGRGICSSPGPSNPMTPATHAVAHGVGTGAPVDQWVAVQLEPRGVLGPRTWRMRQVRRAHRLLDAAERRRAGLRRPPRRC